METARFWWEAASFLEISVSAAWQLDSNWNARLYTACEIGVASIHTLETVSRLNRWNVNDSHGFEWLLLGLGALDGGWCGSLIGNSTLRKQVEHARTPLCFLQKFWELKIYAREIWLVRLSQIEMNRRVPAKCWKGTTNIVSSPVIWSTWYILVCIYILYTMVGGCLIHCHTLLCGMHGYVAVKQCTCLLACLLGVVTQSSSSNPSGYSNINSSIKHNIMIHMYRVQ